MSDEMIEKALYKFNPDAFVNSEQGEYFTAGYKAASKPLKDGDSYYVYGQKVYTQDYVEKLEKKLFNEQEHYTVLKQNYDAAFEWFAESTDQSAESVFEQFIYWSANEHENF